jgi:actin-related protein
MASDIVAFDLGSGTVKCGAVTEAAPTVCLPTIVGHRAASKAKSRLLKKATEEPEGPSILVGDRAISQLRAGTVMHVGYPIERGVVTNWDDMELLFSRCFEDLMKDPAELSIVLAIPPFNPVGCTERIAQTMFESFNVERFATVPQGLCALYASGRTTGVVLDVGHGITTVTPVFDSYAVSHAMNRLNVGGADVTDHLQRLLFERGYTFTTPLDLLTLRDLKDAVATVAEDYKAALALPDRDFETAFELPDGTNVTVGKERFRCSEILFDPSIVHSEQASLAEFVANAIQACPIDTRRAISGNVVLSGGTTQMPGFGARLQDGVASRFPGMFGSVHVLEGGDRTLNVWSGASVLANMSSFEPSFVTREVYDEHGPEIVHNYYDHSAAANDDDAPPPPPDD